MKTIWKINEYIVLDTAAGVSLDRHGLVTVPRGNKGQAKDPSLELICRCRHAAASVGVRLYVYEGLRGGKGILVNYNPFAQSSYLL
ncbi:putative protein-serine/threonine phosphatase [Helianthus anomalus]